MSNMPKVTQIVSNRTHWDVIVNQLTSASAGHKMPREKLKRVDLKGIARSFSSKMGLFRNYKELQIGTCNLTENHVQVLRNKREETLLQKRSGDCYYKQTVLPVGLCD